MNTDKFVEELSKKIRSLNLDASIEYDSINMKIIDAKIDILTMVIEAIKDSEDD